MLTPPYPHSTRRGARYRHEMTDDDHRDLARVLHDAQGMVVISGYACDLYADLYADWQRIEKDSYADGRRTRIEVLWLSPSTSRALNRSRLPLFAAAQGGEA